MKTENAASLENLIEKDPLIKTNFPETVQRISNFNGS